MSCIVSMKTFPTPIKRNHFLSEKLFFFFFNSILHTGHEVHCTNLQRITENTSGGVAEYSLQQQ